MIIDAHVHFMPPSLAERLEKFSEEEPYWGLLMAPGGVQGWATAERMLEDMDAASVDRVVIQGAYCQKHESCVQINNEVMEVMHRYPEQVSAFAVLQPRSWVEAVEELKRCVDGGMCGVGELNPYGQGMTMDDPDFLRLVEACIYCDIPLNLHVSEEVGHFYPGKTPTPLGQYYDLARRYPELKLILSHWGGGLIFYEIMPEVRKRLKNVLYDTATTPLLYPTAKIFPLGIQAAGAKKIIFGSDYPLLLYPRKQREPDFRTFLGEIYALNLDGQDYADIMGGNVARLLGLDVTGEEKEEPWWKNGPPSVSMDRAMAGYWTSPELTLNQPVGLIARNFPATRAVFEKYGIPWKENILPFWVPVNQAAAVVGCGPTRQEKLLQELQEVVNSTPRSKIDDDDWR